MRLPKLSALILVAALAGGIPTVAAGARHAKKPPKPSQQHNPSKSSGKHKGKKPPKHKPQSQTVVVKNGGPFPPPNPPADLSTPCANTDLVPDSGNVAQVRAAILCLVNQERAKQGIGALKDYGVLDGVAQSYSDTVVADDNFDHTGKDGSTPDSRVLAAHYVAPKGNYAVGENLGAGESDNATPAVMVNAWMNSPEHRANILDPTFEESGVGVTLAVPPSMSTGAKTGATYVQDFGVRGTDVKKKKPSKGSSSISFGRGSLMLGSRSLALR